MTPRQKAVFLLTIHQGACSVRKDSAIAATFQIMEMEQKVKTRDSGTAGYMDVYANDFKPRFAGKEDK